MMIAIPSLLYLNLERIGLECSQMRLMKLRIRKRRNRGNSWDFIKIRLLHLRGLFPHTFFSVKRYRLFLLKFIATEDLKAVTS
jgi:hypothetical protein